LGVNEDWAPYVIRTPSGGLEGFEVDLLQMIGAATGANLKLVAGRWEETVEQAERRELDGLAMTVANQDRATSFIFSDRYLSVYPAFILPASNLRRIEKIEDLYGDTVAILAGHKFYRALLAEHPAITVIAKPTENEVISSVVEGVATAAIISTTSFDKYYKSFAQTIRIAYVAHDKPLDLVYSFRKDWPELVSIFNKGLAAVPKNHFNESYYRWFGMPPMVSPVTANIQQFSPAEQAWLSQKITVRARVGNAMPFHSSEQGPHGMSVDYLNAIAQKAGFKVDYRTNIPWLQSLSDLREHRHIDLLLTAARTPEREAFLLFTENYLLAPSVIFTRENSPFVSSIDDLANKTVLVENGFVIHKRLEHEYPSVRLLVKKSTEEALTSLAEGEGDAYIGNLTSGAYFLRTKNLDNVKVTAPSPFGNHDQAMAIRIDWPELVGIINKTLATFSPEEHAAIRDRWLPPIRYEYGISRRDVFTVGITVGSILLSIIAVVMLSNKRLAREIAARTAAETTLRTSEANLQKAQEIAKIGSWTLELNGKRTWSEEMFRVFGVTPATFSPTTEAILRLVHQDDRKTVLDWIDAVSAGEQPGELIFRAIAPDGDLRFISARGELHCDSKNRPAFISGTAEDITERKLAEDALRKALNFTEILLNESPVGIRVFDGVSGICIMVNQAAADIAGGDANALLQQNFRKLQSWHTSGLTTLAETVLADGKARQIETEMTTSFGKTLASRYFFARFFVEDQPHLMTIGQDISEEKRLGLEKKQIEEQMLHVQKLESLGVLAGGIAHDFNNILMAVIAHAELALKRLPPESPAINHLQQIQLASNKAADLAGQMLAYSGKGKFVVEPLDLNQMIEEMMNLLQVSISKKAHLQFDLGQQLPAVEADATQLRQVMMNLVINAAEALNELNGIITISTGAINCDHDYLSESWLGVEVSAGRYVYCEVKDTGCGMDTETLRRMYEPFFSTKFTGRGLGMAAVLGIVRGHKGIIKVHSEPGKGTTFRVLLPAISGPSNQAVTVDSGKDWCGSGQVLLVDDEQTVRDVCKTMLEELGYDVLTASNGVEALSIFKQHRDTIPLVLMDLTMPIMGGEEAFLDMRKLDPKVKVIMTSGYSDQEISHLIDSKNLSGFIQKPFSISTLRDALHTVTVKNP
jgi:PAS domain S-box-containing protein